VTPAILRQLGESRALGRRGSGDELVGQHAIRQGVVGKKAQAQFVAGREHAICSFRSFEAAVALMEQKISSPFAAKPKFYLNTAAGYATATVRGIGVYEVRS
jgi:hypothetical protein